MWGSFIRSQKHLFQSSHEKALLKLQLSYRVQKNSDVASIACANNSLLHLLIIFLTINSSVKKKLEKREKQKHNGQPRGKTSLCSFIGGPNLQHVKFAFKIMANSHQAFLLPLREVALVDLRRKRRWGGEGTQKANNSQNHCMSRGKGLCFYAALNHFFNMYAPLYVWHGATCRKHKKKKIALNPHNSHRDVGSWCEREEKCMGKRYVTRAGSLYSGVSGRAPHTKPLDEDIKQGFHSLPLLFRPLRRLAPGCSRERQS